MKINGIEVDMKNVVELYEQETYKSKRNKAIRAYWDSVEGQAMRERISERMKKTIQEHIKNNNWHRQKIKFILTDVETNEQTIIYGTVELAKFLGYKKYNGSMTIGTRHNKSKTKMYNIERE